MSQLQSSEKRENETQIQVNGQIEREGEKEGEREGEREREGQELDPTIICC